MAAKFHWFGLVISEMSFEATVNAGQLVILDHHEMSLEAIVDAVQPAILDHKERDVLKRAYCKL
jgi:hypothetical protein